MPLVTKRMGRTAKRWQHAFLSPAQLAQHAQCRRPQAHRAEALRISPQRVGQPQRSTPVICGAGHGVAVTKALKLCGIDGKHRTSLLEQRLYHGAAGHLNGYGHLAGHAACHLA